MSSVESPWEEAAVPVGDELPEPAPRLRPLSAPGFDGELLLSRALKASAAACEYLLAQQKDQHWRAELESNASLTAQYVFLHQALGLSLDSKREGILKYLFGCQRSDGSWSIAWEHSGDVSTTAEVYLALRILGVGEEDDRLKKAESFIRDAGGLEKIRVFTRIHLALFGLFPWEAVPTVPPEFVLAPAQSPINIYALSSWARSTMVPLFIVCHHRPVFALPNEKSASNGWLDHLWLDPANKRIPYAASLVELLGARTLSWRTVFHGADKVLRLYERFQDNGLTKKMRELALRRCEEWVLQRQEKSGDWAGIFPPMMNGVLALVLSGYSLHSDPVRLGLEAIERFCWNDERGLRVESCQSPIWDTILSMIGLIDCGLDRNDERLVAARHWLTKKQLLVNYGDWRVYNPSAPSGGWSFEYHNTWYPDVDDTAAVVIGFLKQDPQSRDTPSVRRAVQWLVSMQNSDGGWAAFDKNNDKLFLNHIPFSDMDSLCDPSSPDVTGRVLEALGLLSDPAYHEACERGLEYLRSSQEETGAWFGRWGVNYVYGTSNVLCGLQRLGLAIDHPRFGLMIDRGLDWLRSVQNPDGGWGETVDSYADKEKMGQGPSTASQTAWALMGLLAFAPANDSGVEAGVRWLVNHQLREGRELGSWHEEAFTGTGFPRHFYIRYHLYRHYFPMMALGRFCQGRLS